MAKRQLGGAGESRLGQLGTAVIAPAKGLSRNKCSNFAKTAQYFQCVIRYS